jgi:hypothetical protein
MKVSQEAGFSPITITLESSEEVRVLWHRLNVSHTTSLKQYAEEQEPACCLDLDILYKNGMWAALDGYLNSEPRLKDTLGIPY